jgi:hypothetical protein
MDILPPDEPGLPEAVRAYLGRTVKLRITERELPRIGTVKRYQLDDPQMEVELLSLSGDVRIFPPGWGGTMDYQPGRLNFTVDENGVITKAYLG